MLLAGGLLLALQASAQNEVDALRFSTHTATGTARSLGMGGAASALGADLSAPTLNPAGLGMYRSSELVFSPSFRAINSQADYLGGSGSAAANNFGFSSIGVAFYNPVYRGYGRNRKQAESGLKSYTFAIGYNQLENFYRKTEASAYNQLSSISDFFAERAQGIPPSQFSDFSFPYLAWQTYLINDIQGLPNSYYGAANGGDVQQNYFLSEEGRRNEWYAAAGLNLDDLLYLGMSVGLQSVRYEQALEYGEQDVNSAHNFFDNDPNSTLEFPFTDMKLIQRFSTSGTGINAQLGVLLRPSDAFRMSLSFRTPTYISLSDNFVTDLEHTYSILDNMGNVKDTTNAISTGQSLSQYNVASPFTATAGAMVLFGKSGFVTFDMDYLNYGTARLRSYFPLGDPAYYSYEAENRLIRENFVSAINLRAGAELRFDIFRLRGGAALYGAPLGDAARTYDNYDSPGEALSFNPRRRLLTLGAGIRQPKYFMDIAFVNQAGREKIVPYSTENANIFDPALLVSRKSNSFVLTVGFKI